jgi:hypothetical protein
METPESIGAQTQINQLVIAEVEANCENTVEVADQREKTCVSPITGYALPPRWKKGESGNPKGRPSAGASIKEWMNILANYSMDEINAIIRDKKAPSAKRIAARSMRTAELERAREERRLILEHTDGKPSQRVTLAGDSSAPLQIQALTSLSDSAIDRLLAALDNLAQSQIERQILDIEPEITVNRLLEDDESDASPINSAQTLLDTTSDNIDLTNEQKETNKPTKVKRRRKSNKIIDKRGKRSICAPEFLASLKNKG